mmetsp:Transcript_12346/g.12370  ORF Transcript_12346/g.12370 Transcript_12346/m.12370 type:complete len:190 (-) Transcript_12346:49-618(-)
MKISDKKTPSLRPICLVKHKLINSASMSKLKLPSKYRRIVLEPSSLQVIPERTPKLSESSASQAYLPFSSHILNRRFSNPAIHAESKEALKFEDLITKDSVQSKYPKFPLPRILSQSNFLLSPKTNNKALKLNIKQLNIPENFMFSHRSAPNTHKRPSNVSKPFNFNINKQNPAEMSFGDIDQDSADLF